VLHDRQTLTPDQFNAKYGSETRRNNFVFETVLTSDNNWQDCGGSNTVESDGRRNVTINGESKSVDTELRQQGLMGDWAWHIGANQTLNCEIFIADPRLD
jgi:hypothetical protein